MKVIDFKGFKVLPKYVVVCYIIALVLALTGMTLMILDMAGMISIVLWAELLPITVSLLISTFCLHKYRKIMFK